MFFWLNIITSESKKVKLKHIDEKNEHVNEKDEHVNEKNEDKST